MQTNTNEFKSHLRLEAEHNKKVAVGLMVFVVVGIIFYILMEHYYFMPKLRNELFQNMESHEIENVQNMQLISNDK